MKIVELLTRVLCDTKPKKQVDGIFLFSQTKDNQKSVFTTACDIINSSEAGMLLCMKKTAMSGYPGFSEWKRELRALGVSSSQIEGIKTVEPELNTLVEANALVRFSKKKGYRSLFVVASPFHQLRAFMTAVTATLREYPDLCIYSRSGVALPWSETVYHSQGSSSGKRTDLIYSELDRIDKYQKKGDLASLDAVLAYLDTRKDFH